MRLGDYIDDHCSRCKRTTDHAVVADGRRRGTEGTLPHLLDKRLAEQGTTADEIVRIEHQE